MALKHQTIEWLSQASGVPLPDLNEQVVDENRPLSLEVAAAVADALGTTPDVLVFESQVTA